VRPKKVLERDEWLVQATDVYMRCAAMGMFGNRPLIENDAFEQWFDWGGERIATPLGHLDDHVYCLRAAGVI
jgi:hypothetical protein